MKIKLLPFLIMIFSISTSSIWAAPITEDFDGFTNGSYGNYTYNSWTITNGLSEAANSRSGRAVRLNNSGSRSLQSPSKLGGVGTIEFWYRHWDGDANTVDYDIQTSPDGVAWTTVGQITTFNSTTYTQFTSTVNDASAQYVRVIHVSGNERFIIDDFSITDAITTPPDVTLTSSATAAGTVDQGATNHILYSFDIATTTANATLEAVDITTAGTYLASDVSNLKLWYSTDATFNSGVDTELNSLTTGLGAGLHTFGSLSQIINDGTTGYFFITTDLACGATIVNTITTTDLTFTSLNSIALGVPNPTIGGAQSITAITVSNVSAQATSNCVNEGTTVDWTNPTACFDEILVFATSGSFTAATPSGDGSSYTANTAFGGGTAFDGGFCVYKNTGTTVAVTALTNGTAYTYKIFTRNGTAWSSGVSTSCTPTLTYCDPSPSSVDNDGITRIQMGTIDNSTGVETNNYGDYSAMIASFIQGDLVNCDITYQTGFTYNTKIWVDWNQDGDFDDAGEEVYTGTSTANNPTTLSTSFTIPLATNPGAYRLRIGGADIATPTPCYTGSFASFEDYTLQVDPPCIPTHTVSSFSPTSAPIAAEITITGTGFTLGSTVSIGGVAATVTFVDVTTLVATVPATAVSGDIVVTEAVCDETIAGFTLIEQNGACGSVFSDLIISEVFDNNGGSLGYIEIYNGTGATIDLTNYRIDRFGTLASAAASHSYDFPATGTGSSIADGEVLVGRISSGGSGVEDFDFAGSNTIGFNDDDRLELIHIPSGTLIDDFHDAIVGIVGYVYRRNTNITGPNPTFTASEWNTATAGDESDLGIFIAPNTSPSINTQPTDVSACAINMSISATAGNGGTLTYQWYYNENDGIATGWTMVNGAAFPNATVAGEASDNLSITGDLADYDGYQFYCEVTEDATCNVPSEAVQFILNAERFFRSVTTGNWTDAASWEMASSAAGPWSSACTYPIFDNSDYIHILNTHNITLDQTLTVDEVVVETGGTLTIGTATKLFFNNGTGVDLLIEGTLVDNGISSSSGGINFSNLAASWEMGTNGTIVKTGNSSVVQYRDNYETGIANIPATANWIYRYTAAISANLVDRNMFYPNLFFESTAGDYSFASGNEVLGSSTGFMTVKGNMSVGATGTDAVEIFNTNTNASMLLIEGNLIIGGNASGSRSKLANEFGGSVGTGIRVAGNLLIHSNGELDYDDGVNSSPEGIFALSGNWTNLADESNFQEGESNVIFEGTVTQDLNTTTGFERFYNIEMSKPNGVLNALSDVRVINDVSFNNGIIDNSFGSTFLFEVDATSTNPSDASHVNGPVNKITDNVAVSNFTFPTGKNGQLGLIGIETRLNTGEEFLAEYYDMGYGTYNVNPAELDHVSRIEWWELDDVNNLGEEALVTLHWRAHSDVVSVADLRVAHFYTEAPSVVNQWEREGASPVVAGGSTVTAGSLTSAYVTSFSPFTLADIRLNGGSLPLDLLNFEAEKVAATAELTWQVANDRAGDRHCIQRSTNAQEFNTLGCIDATQDQATANYLFTDETPLSGDNYYRIAHTDIDGELNYSPIRVLNFESKDFVTIYPNPVQDILNVDFPQATEAINLEIVDALGRVVLFKVVDQTAKNIQINTSDLAAGHYVLRIKINQQITRVQKFEKK